MTILIIISLLVLGIILLLLEFAVIPGFTIAGVGGMVLLGYSVYLSYVHYGTWAGTLTVVFVIAAIPFLFMKFLKSKAGKKMQLDSSITGKTNLFDKGLFRVGDKGKAISRLAPMGKIEVNNQILEGKSTGDFIDDGAIIEIVSIQDNKLIVKQIFLP